MTSNSPNQSSISTSPMSRLPTSTPSSPPPPFEDDEEDYDLLNDDDKALFNEEKKAQLENDEEEAQRIARHEKEREAKAALKIKGKSKKEQTREQTKQLEKLLEASALFSEKLKSKTEVLGKVGSSLDGNSLAQNGLKMAQQPECMIGGQMRGYQLEGLTWMYEVASHGMSGILADEMGLGKTIQTIGLVSKFRDEGFYGPFLIIAPLSTLSNWQEEFEKWAPTIPVAFYHGLPQHRRDVLAKECMPYLNGGKPTKKFPIVLTTPEIVIRDAADLSKVTWDILIIDEGHRLKNSGSKLFKLLQTFKSYSRFLITGTPLQNNLKELWSLLHFLHPRYFSDWEMFESWFDLSEIEDEEGAKKFVQDKTKQALLKKMHVVLQPLLLRRIKADVEHLLPKKREYVLYAPMTKEQTDLYNAIVDDKIDTRKYLEDQVVQRLSRKTIKSPSDSALPTPAATENSDSEDYIPISKLVLQKQVRGRGRSPKEAAKSNAFQQMMAGNSKKRKSSGFSTPISKSVKSSRSSTPAMSVRGPKARGPRYTEAHSSDDDELSDDEFEAKLAEEAEAAQKDDRIEWHGSTEEMERAKILELARKEVANKKLGNNDMQLRLVCNSVHNFYNPWPTDSGLKVDSTLITSSGKMLLLDRLLPYLLKEGHKVLIFSQFKTQLDILEDYARELRGWPVCRIDGSVAQEVRREQIYSFNNDPDYKLFLLSTRAGGQGINLATADTVILFDSDWNPQQDLQAQDRAHRIGQKNPVIIYRFATRGTVEESLLESANAKRRLEKLVIKKDGFKSLSQKIDNDEEMSGDAYNSVLLKDGQEYEYKSSKKLLTREDLRALCDRSEEAYVRAEKGGDNSEKFEAFKTEMVGFIEREEEEMKVGKNGRGRPAKRK